MLFNSFHFAIFYLVVTSVFFALPQRVKMAWLLAASMYFYMVYVPWYILVLSIAIGIDFFAGLYIGGQAASARLKRFVLVVSVGSTCLLLGIFKYYDFMTGNLVELAHFLGWSYSVSALHLALPIGLSFHTFQSLSYVIEVYRGNQKAEKSFFIYSLYVLFYPQLVAGPIERPQNLLHQFHEPKHFDWGNLLRGLKLMGWGLFKKIVIADRLALYVNEIYSKPSQFGAPHLILATLFFSFQIYADFSGYSDIARGTALSMGFRLMENFRFPYFSRSIQEFWTRWHVSLSTWFKDYVYIPLGGGRQGRAAQIRNLIIVFGLSGLWHGAQWTFVVWGLLNAMLLILENFGPRRTPAALAEGSAFRWLAPLKTFFLVSICWVFFRAENLQSATEILQRMFTFAKPWSVASPKVGLLQLIRTVLLIVAFWQMERFILRKGNLFLEEKPFWMRWLVYGTLVHLMLYFGVWSRNEFIYFQF